MTHSEAGKLGGSKKGVKRGPYAKTRARRLGRARALRRLEITAERTMLELGRIAFSDIGALFDGTRRLLPLHQLSPAARAAVASLRVTKKNPTAGDAVQEDVVEVKLWDKITALQVLAKHFGLITDRHDVKLQADESLFAKLDQFKARNRERRALTGPANYLA
jgi:hypothetical protein